MPQTHPRQISSIGTFLSFFCRFCLPSSSILEPPRSTTLPPCHETSESVKLSDVVSALNGVLHGPVHIMLGGHWGFNESVVARVHALMDEVGKDPFPDQILLAAKVRRASVTVRFGFR